ncbi:MAG: glutathione S-transferase N-terminal domain-containing protein [Candidatus Neomarinimicrobiota bacterium]
MEEYPILYTFRRCPYAMRARMALAYGKIPYLHREILLKNRPKNLYDISLKGTVPVLLLEDGFVLDESIEIMRWVLKESDVDEWYLDKKDVQDQLIDLNDMDFKKKLDKYKYHIRYPEFQFEKYRDDVSEYLFSYDNILHSQSYLSGNQLRFVDIALMPFIRQCAHVDLDWFNNQFKYLSKWLAILKKSKLFKIIMQKHDIWDEKSKGVLIKWN